MFEIMDEHDRSSEAGRQGIYFLLQDLTSLSFYVDRLEPYASFFQGVNVPGRSKGVSVLCTLQVAIGASLWCACGGDAAARLDLRGIARLPTWKHLSIFSHLLPKPKCRFVFNVSLVMLSCCFLVSWPPAKTMVSLHALHRVQLL